MRKRPILPTSPLVFDDEGSPLAVLVIVCIFGGLFLFMIWPKLFP
jgi:hypothetical protein